MDPHARAGAVYSDLLNYCGPGSQAEADAVKKAADTLMAAYSKGDAAGIAASNMGLEASKAAALCDAKKK
jgi:hypothetical protein